MLIHIKGVITQQRPGNLKDLKLTKNNYPHNNLRMVKQTNAGSVMTPIMDTTAEVGMFCVYVENKGQVRGFCTLQFQLHQFELALSKKKLDRLICV